MNCMSFDNLIESTIIIYSERFIWIDNGSSKYFLDKKDNKLLQIIVQYNKLLLVFWVVYMIWSVLLMIIST